MVSRPMWGYILIETISTIGLHAGSLVGTAQISGGAYKCPIVWKGLLTVKRPGQSGQFETEILTELEGYRGASASTTLAADWPPILEILGSGSQESVCDMLNYCIADFLVFRVLNESTFLEGLRKMKHGIIIKIPCQTIKTLLLYFLDKDRLLGLLYYGDSIPPEVVLEYRQPQWYQQQIHQKWQRQQQQQQQHQQQQQQQQQIHQQWQRHPQQQQQQQQIHQQFQPQQQQQHQQQPQQLQQQHRQPQQQQLQQQHVQLQHPQPQHHRPQQQQQLQQQHFQLQYPQPQHHQPQQQQQLQQQHFQLQHPQPQHQHPHQHPPQQLEQPHFQLQHPQPQPYQPQLEIDPQFLDQNYNAELDIAYLPDSWKS